MRNLVMCLAMGLMFVFLTGCGSSEQKSDSYQSESMAKTGGVNLKIDLRSTVIKSSAKSVHGGTLAAGVVQSYKDEISYIDVYVRTVDNVDVTYFANMPVINGVFDSMQPDGTSMINLPAGEYSFLVDLKNSEENIRFSGSNNVSIIAGQSNTIDIEMRLMDVYVDVAIKQMQGNFEKSDGSYDKGIYYAGSANTDDCINFYSQELAYMDNSGTLHATVELNPLSSSRVWISVVDKDGKTITQALNLNMEAVVAAEKSNTSVEYVYQKTDAINLSITFPW